MLVGNWVRFLHLFLDRQPNKFSQNQMVYHWEETGIERIHQHISCSGTGWDVIVLQLKYYMRYGFLDYLFSRYISLTVIQINFNFQRQVSRSSKHFALLRIIISICDRRYVKLGTLGAIEWPTTILYAMIFKHSKCYFIVGDFQR